MTNHVLGIDLGTTNSVVAAVGDDGRVTVLPGAAGGEVTPSVVYFETDAAVMVGAEAAEAAAIDPYNGVQLIKRSMGTDFPMRYRGQDHTPESISALILRHLVSAAVGGKKDGDRFSAVITVPAYFGLAEREATYQAGVIADLDVLELLAEPVAAAVHYGLTPGTGNQTVLVYDLGGGTFDTTVLRITDAGVTVLATDGDHALGGADIDQRLIDLVLERLATLIPAAELDEIESDERRRAGLVLDVRAAKHDLSACVSRAVIVATAQGRTTVPVTRADLEQACADLFDTTAVIIERVLRAAGLDRDRIDEVLMVGGSSRIPVLAGRLTAQLGQAPRLVDPDLAVAKGAALRAHRLAATPQHAALASGRWRAGQASGEGNVVPVAPRAIGILVEDSAADPSGHGQFVRHIVAANTPLPVERTETGLGTILDNQESVRIQVYEQAGATASPQVGHNRRILDGELCGLNALTAGSVIEITVKITVDGRLNVVARDPGSGRDLRIEAYMEGVVDSAETKRLAGIVGLARVRG